MNCVLDSYQVIVGLGIPVAAASNLAFWPSRTSLSVGGRDQTGASTLSVGQNARYKI